MPDSGSFEITIEDVGDDIRIVALTGDADRFRAEAVTRAVQAARTESRAVVVDLAKTTFMDSSMLAALVAASEQGRKRAERLVLVVKTPRLRRSLEVKGLNTILVVAGSREQAVELLAGRGDASAGESVPEPA